jgi:ketosteroid isomerase-like protein
VCYPFVRVGAAQQWDTGRRVSEKNVDLIRRIFATWEGQNFAAVVRRLPRTFEELPDELRTWIEETYDPNLEASWLADDPEWEIHRGYAGLIRAYADWMEEWDEYYFESKEFIDAGDDVLASHVERGRSRHGVKVELEPTMVFAVRHGSVVRMRQYKTKEEALQALALPK